MLRPTSRLNVAIIASSLLGVLVLGSWATGQTLGSKEDFTAVAIVNNNITSGAGTVLMSVTRWSTNEERQRLVNTLLKQGPDKLLDVLHDNRSTGTIRTPDSLGYDLRFAHQSPTPDGGRRIVLATDRPIGFWEASRQPRTIDYPFTVIQMEIGPEGKGKGTLSYATKISVRNKETIELENFASSPIMLTEITASKRDE